MKKQTGGQAFPRQQWEYDGHNNVLQYQEEGMTLRDYFAAKALSGWLASYPESCTHPIVAGNADEVAKHSYMLADAMLKAREE
ncbi:hypothetical protein [Enterobacter kobei]|uniref:Uncharacterized protein n=1 Tax=Enterobacter kobei TaxID=208224 RepID=A0AAJ6LEG7_9ENTR|nr:hypothetical protein [Enterobacter kobei]EKS6746848.1 hypothetical protein [Enterobacter kobei]KLP79105.1 hypothetical protein ABR38_01700 [Enterobacter kobei]MBW7715589.1 hypothetical protein [Enterobacter kobei]MBW7723828.1 hypothetical protein [Enterobacter kobei]MCE1223864.1 hypothetical protein [Enterobacter kobei]